MDQTGVIYLTNFIKNEVDNREDKLKDIYTKAVRDSDSFKNLNALRKRLVFFDNGVGGTLFAECNDLMKRIFTEPENGQDILAKMNNLTKDILVEESRSMGVLDDFEAPGITVGVLEKSVNERYGSMLNILASSIIFTLLVSGGTGFINGLRWNDNNSLNVKLNIIKSEMLPRLDDDSFGPVFWRIVRIQDDKSIRFCDFRYQIEYISYDDYLMYKQLFKPLNDNLYVDEHVLNSGAFRTVFAGMGNVVTCNSLNCIKRLSEGVLVKDDYFKAVTEETASVCKDGLITTLLEFMAEGKMYIVTPAKVCGLLNQYANAREIYYRKKSGQCLICKKSVDKRLICRDHFKTHERVYY